ncbi:hypothetical protein SESBI_35422 [Sesbania bispinosa]|nr:hypothetical protein SESBI_35422 [Sesbania bispinosa]
MGRNQENLSKKVGWGNNRRSKLSLDYIYPWLDYCVIKVRGTLNVFKYLKGAIEMSKGREREKGKGKELAKRRKT